MSATVNTMNQTENNGKILIETTEKRWTAPERYRFTGEVRQAKDGEFLLDSAGCASEWLNPYYPTENDYPILEKIVNTYKWWEFEVGDVIRPDLKDSIFVYYRFLVCKEGYETKTLLYLRDHKQKLICEVSEARPTKPHGVHGVWYDENFVKVGHISDFLVNLP